MNDPRKKYVKLPATQEYVDAGYQFLIIDGTDVITL